MGFVRQAADCPKFSELANSIMFSVFRLSITFSIVQTLETFVPICPSFANSLKICPSYFIYQLTA